MPHDKVSMALGPRSVLPDQFLTTGTQHINQRTPGTLQTQQLPVPLCPSTPRLAQSSCSLPRSSGTLRGCSGNPGADSAPPSASHQAQLLSFAQKFSRNPARTSWQASDPQAFISDVPNPYLLLGPSPPAQPSLAQIPPQLDLSSGS